MQRLICLVLLVCLLSVGCGFIEKRPFTDAVNAGKVDIGMLPKEVRRVLGDPEKVAKRKIKEGDVREVWTYYEYEPNIFINCITSIYIVPIFARNKIWNHPQYLVFHNDKVVGWNLPDPLVPDLIIETRER